MWKTREKKKRKKDEKFVILCIHERFSETRCFFGNDNWAKLNTTSHICIMKMNQIHLRQLTWFCTKHMEDCALEDIIRQVHGLV